jgi:hypothetical protein
LQTCAQQADALVDQATSVHLVDTPVDQSTGEHSGSQMIIPESTTDQIILLPQVDAPNIYSIVYLSAEQLQALVDTTVCNPSQGVPLGLPDEDQQSNLVDTSALKCSTARMNIAATQDQSVKTKQTPDVRGKKRGARSPASNKSKYSWASKVDCLTTKDSLDTTTTPRRTPSTGTTTNVFGRTKCRIATCSAEQSESGTGIVTQAKASHKATEMKPLQNQTKGPKKNTKKKTIIKSPVIQLCDIPSCSEDSTLSGSDYDDEYTQLKAAATKRPSTERGSVHDSVEVNQSTPKHKQLRFSWKDGSLQKNHESVQFTGISTAEVEVEELQSPVEFFRYFVTNDIIELIVQQTALYSAQQRPGKPLKVTAKEVEQFIGIALYMSLVRLANSRSYWSSQFRVDPVASTMPVNKFEEMKRFLHFSDNSNADTNDKLNKIRPFIDLLRARFLKISMEEHLSLDEQMVPFKGRSTIKQYNPRKPHKWGYKVFVLSGVSGFAYDFECYTGKQDNTMLDGEKDCGASGNVVIRLARSIPSNVRHKLYFDNYFNCPELQIVLAHRGILSLGTVRSNRVSQCTLASDAELKKRGRGSHVEKVAVVDNVELSAVKWYDNRAVTFLSTLVGSQPAGEVTRWSKKDRCHEQIPSPKVVQVYNKHMGGVDLLDSLVGLYRIRIRSKKWYHRICFHLFDLTVVNAWLLYRRQLSVRRANSSPGRMVAMRLHDFKAAVAQALCKEGVEFEANSRKRGRPSADTEAVIGSPSAAKRCRPTVQAPCSDVRLDYIGHWPKWVTRRATCKAPKCTGTSRVICTKCKVHLCFNPNKDCFTVYHTVK